MNDAAVRIGPRVQALEEAAAFRLAVHPSARRAAPPQHRSIISRTDIFQRALAAKAEFYKELATYGEDYLGEQGAASVSEGTRCGCTGWPASWLGRWAAGWLCWPRAAAAAGTR